MGTRSAKDRSPFSPLAKALIAILVTIVVVVVTFVLYMVWVVANTPGANDREEAVALVRMIKREPGFEGHDVLYRVNPKRIQINIYGVRDKERQERALELLRGEKPVGADKEIVVQFFPAGKGDRKEPRGEFGAEEKQEAIRIERIVR